MTDKPGGNVLQFQTAEARLRAEYRKNKAAFLRLVRRTLRASENEAIEMESILLSKGQQIEDRYAELRKRADRLRAKKGSAK